jgi:hypothetical protein
MTVRLNSEGKEAVFHRSLLAADAAEAKALITRLDGVVLNLCNGGETYCLRPAHFEPTAAMIAAAHGYVAFHCIKKEGKALGTVLIPIERLLHRQARESAPIPPQTKSLLKKMVDKVKSATTSLRKTFSSAANQIDKKKRSRVVSIIAPDAESKTSGDVGGGAAARASLISGRRSRRSDVTSRRRMGSMLSLGEEGEAYFATVKCVVEGKRRVFVVVVKTGNDMQGFDTYAFPSRRRCDIKNACDGLQSASDFLHDLLCKLGLGNSVAALSVKKHRIGMYKSTKIYHLGFDCGKKYKHCKSKSSGGLRLVPTTGSAVMEKLLGNERSDTYKLINALPEDFFSASGVDFLSDVTPRNV